MEDRWFIIRITSCFLLVGVQTQMLCRRMHARQSLLFISLTHIPLGYITLLSKHMKQCVSHVDTAIVKCQALKQSSGAAVVHWGGISFSRLLACILAIIMEFPFEEMTVNFSPKGILTENLSHCLFFYIRMITSSPWMNFIGSTEPTWLG